MAAAPPGVVGAPPNFDDTGSHGMTPPRRLQPEDGGSYGQPTEGGGSLAINHANEVARALRDEMLELRSAVMANLEATKRDFDVKKSFDVITLNDKIDKLEHENKDMKEKLHDLSNKIEEERTDAADTRTRLADEVIKIKDDLKDFMKIVKDDEKITEMINKYQEVVIDDEKIKKIKNMMDNIEAKLKQDFDSNIEDTNVRINDVIDRIGAISKNIDERDGMPSSTPLPAAADDKIIEMIKELYQNG